MAVEQISTTDQETCGCGEQCCFPVACELCSQAMNAQIVLVDDITENIRDIQQARKQIAQLNFRIAQLTREAVALRMRLDEEGIEPEVAEHAGNCPCFDCRAGDYEPAMQSYPSRA